MHQLGVVIKEGGGVAVLRRAVEVEQGWGSAAETVEGIEPFQEGLEKMVLLGLEGMMEVCKIVMAAGKTNGGILLPRWMQAGAGAAGSI